jgi:hypothetical protein
MFTKASDDLFNSRSKSRIFYRINHEKLEKYRHENPIPSIKVIHQKTISTQTTFNSDFNSPIDSSTNTLSTNSNSNDHKTSASTHLGTSESNISIDLSSNSSSSLSNSNASSIALDFSDESLTEIQPPKSLHIRSIVRHMFGDYSSDTEHD